MSPDYLLALSVPVHRADGREAQEIFLEKFSAVGASGLALAGEQVYA